MSFVELVLRIFAAAKALVPAMLIAGVITILALVVLLILGRGLWVTQRRFRWLGLFVGMDGRSGVALACAWLKLLFILIFLASFQKLTLQHYFVLVLLGLLCMVCIRPIHRAFVQGGWTLLELVGLLSANLVCGFVRDTDAHWTFLVAYVLMSLFLALFGCYLFLSELNEISIGRRSDLERGWKLAGDEPDDFGDGDGGEE